MRVEFEEFKLLKRVVDELQSIKREKMSKNEDHNDTHHSIK